MSARIYALVPAGGSGSRAGHDEPKQFRLLQGETVLAHALRPLAAEPRIDAVFVVLSPADRHFRSIDWSGFGERLVPLYCGGSSRAATVANGLAAIADTVELEDWVLVHDAARPCLPREDVSRLIDRLEQDPVGGLLAVPVADTLKAGDGEDQVARTVPREGLWQALTPQMFRMGLLLRGLEAAREAGRDPGDEAAAIESLGLSPRLVRGWRGNIKITYGEDFDLAERLLGAR